MKRLIIVTLLFAFLLTACDVPPVPGLTPEQQKAIEHDIQCMFGGC